MEQYYKGLEDYSKRTIEEFVEDLVTNGRTLKQILIVAFCCRWRDSVNEIKRVHRKLLFKVT